MSKGVSQLPTNREHQFEGTVESHAGFQSDPYSAEIDSTRVNTSGAGTTAVNDIGANAAGVAENPNDHFVRHGGVHFRSNVTAQEINNFVRKLPAGKRESLFEVLEQLDNAGLITIVNDHLFADGNGVIGGGENNPQTK